MEERSEKVWTRGFVILILSNFLLFLNLQMTVPTLPMYAKGQFHASDVAVSLVTSMFALSAIVARVFAGQALQKGKLALLLTLGLVLAMAATVGYYWSGTIVVLLLMRMVFGAGFGLSSTTFPTMASNTLPPKRMGEGMGYFGLSTTLAMSIGPVIGLTLLGNFGIGAMIVGAVVALLLVIPLAWSNRKLPMPEPKPTAHSKLFDIKLLLPMVLNALLCVTYGGVLSFLALFGKEAHIANVGVFFLCNALAVVLIRSISGRIFDKKGHVALVIPGALFVIAALVVLSYSTTTLQLMLASLLYGVGFGVLQPTIQTWMIQKVPAEERGMANGMFLNSMDFGVASGALLLGAIAMRTGYMEMYRFAALFMVVFLFVYAGNLVWRNGKNGVRWEKRS
ncbi:MAG: MFS transporter [Tumebacillaceae bacterium]